MKKKIMEVYAERGMPGISANFVPEGLPAFQMWQLETILRRFHNEVKRMNDEAFVKLRDSSESKAGVDKFKLDNEIDNITGG